MAKTEIPGTHEDFSRREEIEGGSDRSFGLVFAAVFALVGVWPMLFDGAPRPWALGVAGLFLAVALVWPSIMAPLNRLWFGFGMLLSMIVNPIIMGLVFYLAVTPTALVMRLLGKDPLRRRFDPTAETYWITREPPGPEPATMTQQF